MMQSLANSGFSVTPKICYVMTDFTDANIRFWKEHPQLKPMVEAGVLDFANYNMITDTEIKLVTSGKTLDQTSVKNPLIAFANYIFDTVPSDAFFVKQGTIDELSINLSTPKNNVISDKQVKELKALGYQYSSKRIKPKRYYEDPLLTRLLEDYCQELKEGNLLIPVSGIRAINHLMDISNQRLLMISSDKAHSSMAELERAKEPEISFHGSFSMTVNYDAIKRYMAYKGAESFIPTPRMEVRTIVSLAGEPMDNMPRLRQAIDTHIEGFAPSDHFITYRHLMDHESSMRLEQVLSFLAFSKWDAYVFNKLMDRISAQLSKADQCDKERLLSKLPTLADNYYYVPGSANTYLNIGVCYLLFSDYATALEFLERSVDTHGESSSLYLNKGLCYIGLSDKNTALVQFRRAVHLDSGNQKAREWVERLS